MKTIFRGKTRALVLLALALLGSTLVVGDAGTATAQIRSALGTQAAQDAAATCDLATMTGNDGGNLGIVNQFFCLANTLGLTGETAGANRDILMGADTVKTHVVIDRNVTIGGHDYEWEAKIWGCNVTVNPPCTSATEYRPVMYVAWNLDEAKTINNGVLAHNFGISSGPILGSLRIARDTGSATVNPSIDLVMMGDDSSPATAEHVIYGKSGAQATLNAVWGSSTGSHNRTALTWDAGGTSNDGAFYEDSDAALNGDTPSATGCFTRAANATDWDYTASADCSAVANTTLAAFPGDTSDDMSALALANTGNTANGVDTVTTFPGDGSPMHGMGLNPPDLVGY